MLLDSHSTLPALFVAGAGLDLLVALLTLLVLPMNGDSGERPRRVTGTHLQQAALLTASCFTLRVMIFFGLGLDLFGVIHMVFLGLCATIPITSTVILALSLMPEGVRCTRRVSGVTLAALVVGLLPAPVGIWAYAFEPYRLEVEQASFELPAERAGGSPLRIGILADVQTGRVTEHEHRAVESLLALEPDIVVLAGDLFQGSARELERELPALRELLARLEAPGGVFIVLGNCDPGEVDILRLIEGTGVRLLVNETATVEIHGRRVTIAGLAMGTGGHEEGRIVAELETNPRKDDIRVLVSHYPDAVLRLNSPSRVDLVIAGHTHGGQIVVPFLGPVLTMSSVPRHVAGGGLHEIDGRRIYVSRGVGLERGQAPPIRFLCAPEVSIVHLR